jgi:hypothetical protein
MRAVLIGDMMAAVQYLAAAPLAQQPQLAQDLLNRADAAHRYTKRMGRAHPLWGLGTIQALALQQKPPDAPRFDLGCPRILAALVVFAAALAARKGHAPCMACLAANAPHVLGCAKHKDKTDGRNQKQTGDDRPNLGSCARRSQRHGAI